MKRALAERVKQEKEAAAAGGHGAHFSSMSTIIHPKAPPSQFGSGGYGDMAAVDVNGVSNVNNLGGGMSGGEGMSGAGGLNGSPIPKIPRTGDSEASPSTNVSLSVNNLVPPLSVSSSQLVAPQVAPVTASPRDPLPAETTSGGVGTMMEIPRRSLPPLPISATPAPQSSPRSPRVSQANMSQSSSPHTSPSQPKKRPRTSTPTPSASNAQESPSPKQSRSSRRTSASSNVDASGPSARSSGNSAAYRSQQSKSDDGSAQNNNGSKNEKAASEPPVKRGRGRPPRNASITSTTSNNASNNRKQVVESDDDDDTPSNSFYLQFQNKALSSELYAYRRKIYLLERERAYRRKECRVAWKKVKEVASVWKGMEAGLGEGLGRLSNLSDLAKFLNQDAPGAWDSTMKKEIKLENDHNLDNPSPGGFLPFSTGSGSDVETVRSLLLAIKGLAATSESEVASGKVKRERNSSKYDDDDKHYHVDDLNSFETYSRVHPENIKEEDYDDEFLDEKIHLDEMDDLATNVANRAARLRDGVLEFLRVVLTPQQQGQVSDSKDIPSVPLLKERIVHLESELRDSEERLEEMAKARNEAVASERRVRRGLYRLASGRMTMDEVLKAVEKEDNGVSFMETIAMIDGMNQNQSVSSPDVTAGVVSSSDAVSSPISGTTSGDSTMNSEEVNQLKKNLQDLKVVSEARDQKISELLNEKEDLLKKINCLLLTNSKESDKSSTDEDSIRKSSLYTETLTKLETAERRIRELEAESEQIRRRWAVMKGDLELAKKTLTDMEGKHERRWNELITMFSDSDAAPKDGDTNNAKDAFSNAKKVAELEHKLQQAMESVNRMETLRATLVDAYKMNEMLQGKLDDLKTKNAKMVAEKSAARAAKESDSITSPQGSSQKRSSSGSSSGDPSMEKLQRDYRKLRKELAAACLSKDQAKLKQERAEKERDALMKTNSRLLKQSSEKDDMNAKSLSTILHLKQRNEELEKESAVVKQKAQAAQQLSLAARLASNAKDRVGEEALREKELLDKTVQDLRRECSSLRDKKESADGLLAQSKEKVDLISKDLSVARERCDELVAESKKKEEEKKKMMESLAVVKKEAAESAKKAANSTPSSSSNGGVKSEFTTEQLNTQVKYLSDRINCPVCNSREKKCILLRCRHMFCRNCVDENIKNRSRKCPACAQRFDMKDVAEIWL